MKFQVYTTDKNDYTECHEIEAAPAEGDRCVYCGDNMEGLSTDDICHGTPFEEHLIVVEEELDPHRAKDLLGLIG